MDELRSIIREKGWNNSRGYNKKDHDFNSLSEIKDAIEELFSEFSENEKRKYVYTGIWKLYVHAKDYKSEDVNAPDGEISEEKLEKAVNRRLYRGIAVSLHYLPPGGWSSYNKIFRFSVRVNKNCEFKEMGNSRVEKAIWLDGSISEKKEHKVPLFFECEALPVEQVRNELVDVVRKFVDGGNKHHIYQNKSRLGVEFHYKGRTKFEVPLLVNTSSTHILEWSDVGKMFRAIYGDDFSLEDNSSPSMERKSCITGISDRKSPRLGTGGYITDRWIIQCGNQHTGVSPSEIRKRPDGKYCLEGTISAFGECFDSVNEALEYVINEEPDKHCVCK